MYVWCAAGHSLKTRVCSPSTLQDRQMSKQTKQIDATCLLTNEEPTYASFLCSPTKSPNVPRGETTSFPHLYTFNLSNHIYPAQTPRVSSSNHPVEGFTCTTLYAYAFSFKAPSTWLPALVSSLVHTVLNFSTTCRQVAERLLAAGDDPVWSLAYVDQSTLLFSGIWQCLQIFSIVTIGGVRGSLFV